MYVDIKRSQISCPVNRYIIIPSQYCLWPFLKSQRAYRTDEQAFLVSFLSTFSLTSFTCSRIRQKIYKFSACQGDLYSI